MALSAKRPSRGDDARKRILHEITETTEKKKRLNAEMKRRCIGKSRCGQSRRAVQFPTSPAIYGLSI